MALARRRPPQSSPPSSLAKSPLRSPERVEARRRTPNLRGGCNRPLGGQLASGPPGFLKLPPVTAGYSSNLVRMGYTQFRWAECCSLGARRRGCGSCGNPGRWMGAGFPMGVERPRGRAVCRPGAFHTRPASTAWVGVASPDWAAACNRQHPSAPLLRGAKELPPTGADVDQAVLNKSKEAVDSASPRSAAESSPDTRSAARRSTLTGCRYRSCASRPIA